MKRSSLSVLALPAMLMAVLLAAVPVGAQETILGYFEGQTGDGNTGTGAMTLRGWALADSGIRQVIVKVDGVNDGSAIVGRTRPEVERLFPGFPDSPAAGFFYHLNSTRYLNGLHTFSVQVISNAGNTAIIDGTREYLLNNNTSLLTPFGKINAPHRNAQLFGTCDNLQCNDLSPRRRVVPVEGWVLDLGVETNDAGVGYVELMIDNQPIYNTRTGCRFLFNLGGFTNCYGLPRPDIERNYPFARDAFNAGFRFVLDIGFLINCLGYVEGQHLITIRSGDTSNQIADVDEIPVVFRCVEGIPNEGAFGQIESPRDGVRYDGGLRVQGWLLDPEGVDRVLIFIDGEFVGEAAYGEEDGIFETRPNVFSQYPGFPGIESPVFRLIPDFDTNELTDGSHQLQVVVKDREGDRSYIGEVTFFVDNRDDG